MKSASPGSRGCGDARPGCYLLGGMSPGGILAPVTLCAGSMTSDDDWNLRFAIEPQLMHWVDPERTFDERKLWFMETSLHDRQRNDYTGSSQEQIKRLGAYGLMHHVGSSYYSAYTHLLETAERGPSLRVDPRIAAQISKFLPLRIFFVFPKLPYFDDSAALEGAIAEMREMEPVLDYEGAQAARTLKIPLTSAEWGGQTAEYDWGRSRGIEPTWGYTDWGGTIYDDNGLRHDYLKLLSWASRKKAALRQMVEDSGVLYYSWATKAIEYVAQETVEKRLGRPVSDEEVDSLDHTEFLSPKLAAALEAGEANVEAVVLKPRKKGESGHDYPFN
jgi:hypothetical protein